MQQTPEALNAGSGQYLNQLKDSYLTGSIPVPNTSKHADNNIGSALADDHLLVTDVNVKSTTLSSKRTDQSYTLTADVTTSLTLTSEEGTKIFIGNNEKTP